MRILALTKYGNLAASSRQRFALYEPALAAAGFSVEYAPLLGNEHLERLVAGQPASPVAVLRAYLERFIRLVRARRYDVLWVHCELFPYLPGFLERLGTMWGKPIVFDYDDAIFHMYDASQSRLVRSVLAGKLAPLLRSASACCCGNRYLYEYALRYCPSCIVLPTVVDTDRYFPAARGGLLEPAVIGWIGSPSTWANVRPLLPILSALCRDQGVRIRAIGAGPAAERDRFDGLDLVQWSESSEIAEVQAMDIGIMPLVDRPFQRGKSGYKLIQYMACGLPVVASPVGVNSEIVIEGESGMIASSEEEWRDALTRLIRDPELRARMGAAGRARAVEHYSLASQAPRLVELFRSVVAKGRG